MPLTTVASGRVYDWSHAVGRGAATGTGFNYVQTMCLGKDGDIYTANRGNENNFGMRVNKSSSAAPAKRNCSPSSSNTAKATAMAPGRSASPSTTNGPCLLFGRMDQHDLGVRHQRQVPAQVRQDRQRRRRAVAPGRARGREERQPHRRRQRQQPAAGVHPGGQVRRRSAARPAAGPASSTSLGASPSTRTATSTSPTGRTTASRSCPRRASP